MKTGLKTGLVTGLKTGLGDIYSGREYPASSSEWSYVFPTIAVPTSLWTMQGAGANIDDEIGSNDLVDTGTWLYQQAGDDGRYAVEADTITDQLRVASAAALDPDGATDMTYWVRVFMPATGDNPDAIFSKRSGSGLPGFEAFIDASGQVNAVQDGGASGRSDFVLGGDIRGRWVDIAYVIDRTGSDEGRLETTDGTASGSLSAITSLASTQGFGLGRNDAAARSTEVGIKFGYAAAWDGTALTRAQLLEIWNQ